MKNKKNILLVSHYTPTPGPMNKLVRYFQTHRYNTTYITFPLYPQDRLPVIIKNKDVTVTFTMPSYLQYIFEGVATYFHYRNLPVKASHFDLCICGDPLAFVHLYLFKNAFRIKKIAYLNVDYTQRRFYNPLLNWIYLKINQFAISQCTYLLYLIPELIKHLDPTNKYSSKSFLLRHWFNSKNIDTKQPKKTNSIIFAGNIVYALNFEPLLEALVKLKKNKIPFQMDIYGEGDRRLALLERIKELKLDDVVNYKGLVENQILTQKIFPSYLIGVCPYITKAVSGKSNHMFNLADLSTKLTEYCAAGLPIVTTRLSSAFDVIPNNKFGFLVKNSDEWYYALKKLLQDNKLQKEYNKNSLSYSKQYDEEKVLTPVLSKFI